MDTELLELYHQLKQRGLTHSQEQKILSELQGDHSHEVFPAVSRAKAAASDTFDRASDNIYAHNDPFVLQDIQAPSSSHTTCLRSVDELLERDKKREADGFPRKIRIGRMIKPGKGDKDKVVVVPTTVEEKFFHDPTLQPFEEEQAGGAGDGEENETIGEEPLRPQDVEQGSGPGEGDDGQHEIESNAYDMGKILTEQFELPNLKDKGKKRSLTRYTYDMTDRNRGFGQIIDKKATLRKIVETNISLGNLPDVGNIDPTGFLIAPNDKIYRILSREKDYESQAMVFFLRDYSGSMIGKATELVVSQHVLIYSWLLYQYARQVETRFIVHDTKAKEVKDFYTYYNSKVAGGTQVSAAYRMVNEMVEKENLKQDYNIYIFHGTDGDDWDTSGKEALPELNKMLAYANRIGITIAAHASDTAHGTEVERYLNQSKLLQEKPKLLRLDVLPEDSDEKRLIEGIKRLISE